MWKKNQLLNSHFFEIAVTELKNVRKICEVTLVQSKLEQLKILLFRVIKPIFPPWKLLTQSCFVSRKPAFFGYIRVIYHVPSSLNSTLWLDLISNASANFVFNSLANYKVLTKSLISLLERTYCHVDFTLNKECWDQNAPIKFSFSQENIPTASPNIDEKESKREMLQKLSNRN